MIVSKLDLETVISFREMVLKEMAKLSYGERVVVNNILGGYYDNYDDMRPIAMDDVQILNSVG